MKFDVFVSFRGFDTRRTFVSHLLLSLFKNQITTFKHEEEILENQPPSSQVRQAIEKSKIAIVVISKNYAASTWSLDELKKIYECNEKGSLDVVPVFYEVDPSDVLSQVDDLGNNGDGDDNLKKVKTWRDAMEKLIETDHQKYSYWEDEDSYTYIIQELETPIQDGTAPAPEKCAKPKSCGVKPRPPVRLLDVQNENYVIGNKLSQLVLSNDFNSFVGMDRLMKKMYSLLDLESKDAILAIGICGKSGVGKTTLARCVYEELSPQFQNHHYFVNETTNCYPCAFLLDYIAVTSLTEQSESFQEFVKVMLGHRKVLLIVDNMFDIRHLKNIRNIARWFGQGSRLIMVTEAEHLLNGMERRYVVEPLRYDEALQLFSQFAFKKEKVSREYYQLSVRAVTIIGRIPLALKVFGTFLCGKHIRKWEDDLCRFETPQSKCDCVAEVSSYIGRALS